MLGGVATRIEAPLQLLDSLSHASETMQLTSVFAATLDVNRAMFANRTNRGFSTSSELAELLAIDLQIPANDAFAIVERVVAEALLAGQDATDLRTELVDRIALELIGRELGIEPELLSRCLAPKRFIERRDVFGGPAPRAVMESLEREHAQIRHDTEWSRRRTEQLDAAQARLQAHVAELAGDDGDSAR
jgi:argininosuccinate lyase